jgi:hypothetical protein
MMGVWMRVEARIFMEFPFPLLAPVCGSFLKRVYRFGGGDARFLFVFCLVIDFVGIEGAGGMSSCIRT